MITDEGLKQDKDKLLGLILQTQSALNQKQQELQQLQTQLIRQGGVLDYIEDNTPKPKGDEKCSEEI